MKLKKASVDEKTTAKAVKNEAKKEEKKTTAKKSAKAVGEYTVDDIGKLAEEYSGVAKQVKALTDKKNKLADSIKEGAEKFGTKDDKGSYYLEVNGYMTGKVKKVSMSLDHETGVEFLKKKGLADLIDKVTVETINEQRLEQAVGEGRITLADINKFTNEKVTYQVSVKEIENMPEVEQTTAQLAANRK